MSYIEGRSMKRRYPTAISFLVFPAPKGFREYFGEKQAGGIKKNGTLDFAGPCTPSRA